MTEKSPRPFSIKIFVPDGDPDGLRIVEKSNWTGVGVVFRRTNYKRAVCRNEFERTGVYVLVGSSEESSMPTIYVGEGAPVKDRFNQHYSKKEFWEWAVFFTSKDGSMNKADVKYIEARLLELAKNAKQCKLDNTQPSLPPSLTESEIADNESFLSDILNIFPLLGLGVFEKVQSKASPKNLLYISAKGVKATGYEDAKGFVVRQGSQMVQETVTSAHNYLATLRNDLIEQGVVEPQDNKYVFTQDQVFGSPSMAAGVVLGRNENGRLSWKKKDGTTLKSLQTTAAGITED